MKRFALLLILVFAGINFSLAQTPALFGTCYLGGTSNSGTIFQSDINGNNLTAVHSFVMIEGRMPWGKIVQAPNGKIYGVTFMGGCVDSCTLYEYDPIAHTCVDVHDFYCNPPYSGEPSQGGLIILPDGNLYGLQQNGIIYKFNPNTHVYTFLHYQAGANYIGGLMQASDGAFYGVSYMGGTYGVGFIFRYDLSSGVYTTLNMFDGTSGGHPYYENLIQANGKLYGTTYDGGAYNKGVIFSYDPLSNVYTDIHDFDSTQGSYPSSGLMQAANGKLYGMTYLGGTNNNGVIFSYDIITSQYSVLYYFDMVNGANPQRGLTQASNGKLFGTTHNGGANNGGVAFNYDISTSTYTKLIDFTFATGANPQSDFLEASLPMETGINEINASYSIFVDASNQLVVQGSALGSSSVITLYDAVGKNVFQSEISNQKSEFDLSSFQRGVYFVQLKSGGEMVTQKIILSK